MIPEEFTTCKIQYPISGSWRYFEFPSSCPMIKLSDLHRKFDLMKNNNQKFKVEIMEE